MNINYSTVVDLTHPLRPGVPCWPGDPAVELRAVATVAAEGYHLQRITLGEHSGTHIGVASHFHPGDTTAEHLDPRQLIVPAVVVDISSSAAADNDYALGVADLRLWEGRHGAFPAGGAVLLHTGWDRHWNDPAAYFGGGLSGGAMHTPGFGLDAARFLAEERGITGLGIDTHGVDPGSDTAFSVNDFWLRGRRFHLENLANLGSLPPAGITLFIGALSIAGGGGAPARVLALAE